MKNPKSTQKPSQSKPKQPKMGAVYDFPGSETYGSGLVRIVKGWVVVERADSGAPPGEAEKLIVLKSSLVEVSEAEEGSP